jgi:heme exporter protein C
MKALFNSPPHEEIDSGFAGDERRCRYLHGPWARYATPSGCFDLAAQLEPWFWAGAAVFALTGLALGATVVPAGPSPGEAYRIAFFHVPAVWTSLVVYLSMVLWAGVGITLSTRVSFMMVAALAPTGATMTLIALWTGALWGRPIAGVWWAWSPQLAAQLLLLALYLGFIALQVSIDDPARRDHWGARLALGGAVAVPLLHLAVQASSGRGQDLADALDTLPPLAAWKATGLAVMIGAFWAWSIAASLHRIRSIILERDIEDAGFASAASR